MHVFKTARNSVPHTCVRGVLIFKTWWIRYNIGQFCCRTISQSHSQNVLQYSSVGPCRILWRYHFSQNHTRRNHSRRRPNGDRAWWGVGVWRKIRRWDFEESETHRCGCFGKFCFALILCCVVLCCDFLIILWVSEWVHSEFFSNYIPLKFKMQTP